MSLLLLFSVAAPAVPSFPGTVQAGAVMVNSLTAGAARQHSVAGGASLIGTTRGGPSQSNL